MTRRWLVLLSGMVVALILTACGIQPDGSARTIEPPPGPYGIKSVPPPTEGPSGEFTEKLFFIKDGTLAPVTRKVTGVRSVQQLLNDLLAGPTDDETAAGVSSALPGNNVIGAVTVVNHVATVDLGSGLEGTGRNDEVPALGQVVCTLDARSDIDGVVFQQSGQTIAVPRADGALASGPLTTADYASLLTS